MATKRVKTGSLYQPSYRDRKGNLKRSAVWWMQFYLPGQPRPMRESTGCEDWDDALVALQRRVGSIAGVQTNLRAETCRISDLLQMVLDDYKANNRASYADLKSKIDSRLNPFFGRTKARSLTTGHITSYQAARRKEGAANASINRELAPLRRALTLGHKHTPQLVHSPIAWKKLEENNVREGILPAAKYAALRDSLPGYLRLAFVIAYHCGCRKGELLAIPRERVDLNGRRIYLEAMTTKNRTPRFLPVYGEMEPYLEMQLAELEVKYPGCLWLIHNEGRRIDGFRKAWETAVKAAGIPDLLFHDLRRTALTNMENAGVPRSVATSISGHKTEHVYKRYLIRKAEAIDRAGETMAAYLGSQAKPVRKPGKGIN
jgi:integrase